MPGSEKLEFLFALIDGCKERGVKSMTCDIDGHVSFELHPAQSTAESLLQALARETPKKVDPTKCVECQVAAPDRGAWCRACYLKQAGVQS